MAQLIYKASGAFSFANVYDAFLSSQYSNHSISNHKASGAFSFAKVYDAFLSSQYSNRLISNQSHQYYILITLPKPSCLQNHRYPLTFKFKSDHLVFIPLPSLYSHYRFSFYHPSLVCDYLCIAVQIEEQKRLPSKFGWMT